MLHGPWIANMLSDHFGIDTGGGGGPITIDLATRVNLYNSTTAWNGSYLEEVTPGAGADFTFPILMDAAKTYAVEVDYSVTQGSIGTFVLYSVSAATQAGADASQWYDIHVTGSLSGSGTLTFNIGPGILQWDTAHANGEPYLIHSIANHVRIHRIELDDGSVPTTPPDPVVVKAMAVTSTHVPSASTEFRAEIAGELSGGGYVQGGVVVSGVTIAWDAAQARAFLTCDLVDFGAVTAADVGGVVFYVDSGSAATDRVLWTDTFAAVEAQGALSYQPSPTGAMEIQV
jgi:hypothetical protein